jgi:hypothetical protein
MNFCKLFGLINITINIQLHLEPGPSENKFQYLVKFIVVRHE